jgi:DNA polymerase-1
MFIGENRLNSAKKYKTILLIDGNNIAYRSFFAIPNLTTSQSLPTNAIYGFLSMLIQTKKEMKPDYMAVCFDSKEKTFRSLDMDTYKAQRKPMPDSLIVQMKILKEDVLPPLNIPYFEKPGFEADDLLATLSNHFDPLSVYVSILSGDRDMIQIVRDNHLELITPVSGFRETKIFHEKEVWETYGITPSQMVDYKAIVGDASDNIPGAPGIGPKTAQKLLEKFGSLEEMLKDASKDTEKLRIHEQVLRRNQNLIQLIKDVPIHIDTERLESKPWDLPVMIRLLQKFEFKSLLKKVTLPNNTGQINQTIPLYENNIEWGKLMKEPLLSIVLDSNNNLVIYHQMNHYILSLQSTSLFGEDKNAECLLALLQNKNCRKITYDGKKLLHYLNPPASYHWNEVIDMQLLWYLWKPNATSYEEKSFQDEFSEPGQPFEAVLWETYQSFLDEIKALHLMTLLQEVELPLIPVLFQMEKNGIKVDRSCLLTLQQKLGSALVSLQQEINQLAGTEINILSPKQLSFLLFEKLGLPVQKKTKTGFSTDADVLTILSTMHPIVPKILEFKELSKIQNTYVESYLKLSTKDSILHTTYLQAGPATGRIASITPNLQNIPMDARWGKEVRKAIIPRSPGNIFISGDYSQIDLRVMAHFSKDPNLLHAFLQEEDVHATTARLLFSLSKGEQPADWMRTIAKTVNFGVLYGMTSHGLAETLQISDRDAKRFIDTYFTTFCGVKEWIDKTIQATKKNGYVETILGRRRQIPELQNSNKIVYQLGHRLAVNSIIQGSSADIIKLAMLSIDKILPSFPAILVLQIHDELVIEGRNGQVDSLKATIQQTMESAYILDIPLRVNVSTGKNLAELK